MYKLVAFISILIRQLYIPNPFEPSDYAIIINILIEPILHLFTYNVVGLYYSKGSNPVIGSLLYLVFHIVHIGLLMIMGFFQWSLISIVITFIVYIIILVFIKVLSEGSFY
jgi:hypothetical protein